jgi:hypothetical protein
MNAVEQLDALIELAQSYGYRVRYEYFGGTGGGFCQFNGGKWLFIDLALSPHEQVEALQQELASHPALQTRLHLRDVA